jgi:hypothetical protein
MMRGNTWILTVGFIVLLTGCQKDLTRQELIDYTFDPTHGLYKRETRGNITIEVVYRPSQLIAEQDARGMNLTPDQADSINNYFSGIDYFLLRLSNNADEIENAYAQNRTKFNEISNYLSYRIADDVFLLQGSDTLHATDFIRTQTHGASPSTDILFGFRPGLNDKNGDFKFIFDDLKFNTGLNEFDFDLSDLRTASHIQLIDKNL